MPDLFTDDEVKILYDQALVHLKPSGLKWTSMTLIHRGTNSSDLRPTLLITAWDLQKDAWWNEILPRLKGTCPLVSDGKVDVKLLHGGISYASDRSHHDLTPADFGQQHQMGGGIGAAGSNGSGTIGAAVKLRIGQNSEPTIVLTNHHVTAQDKGVKVESTSLQSPL